MPRDLVRGCGVSMIDPLNDLPGVSVAPCIQPRGVRSARVNCLEFKAVNRFPERFISTFSAPGGGVVHGSDTPVDS